MPIAREAMQTETNRQLRLLNRKKGKLGGEGTGPGGRTELTDKGCHPHSCSHKFSTGASSPCKVAKSTLRLQFRRSLAAASLLGSVLCVDLVG